MRFGRTILILAFVIAATATTVLGARLVASTLYWSRHQDAPIETWMTVGMVSRSYDVPRSVVAEAAGVPDGTGDRRPLAEIASAKGIAPDDLIARLNAAIADHRSADADRTGGEP